MRQITAALLAIGLILGFSGIYSAQAQSGGQFCVRSFEDTNGNGVLDPSTEPLLSRGISVELLDANTNIVIASALLDKSPNAASGIICFQGLTDGDYSVLISSADYQATTDTLITATVSSTALPTVIEFGAQRVSTTTTATTAQARPSQNPLADMSEEELQSFVLKMAVSVTAAILVMIFFLIIGFIIYYIRLRPMPVPAMAYNAPPPPPESYDDDFPTFTRNQSAAPDEDTSEIIPPTF